MCHHLPNAVIAVQHPKTWAHGWRLSSVPEAQIASDIEIIHSEGGEIGLHLSNKKCELICKDGRANNPVFQSFVYVEKTDATLLGAPLTNGRSMEAALLN